MKVRNGFVSNSSSSSFIIGTNDYDNVFAVAKAMIPCREWNDGKIKADNILIKKIEKAQRGVAGINPNTPIAFSTCNYPTYIVRIEDRFVIATCNNHDWDGVFDYYGNQDIPNQLSQKGIKHMEEIDKIGYLFDFWYPEHDIVGRAINSWYEDLPNYKKGAESFCKKCCHDMIYIVKNDSIICPNCDKKKKGAK